jgi:hypothetical protein
MNITEQFLRLLKYIENSVLLRLQEFILKKNRFIS